VTRRCWLGSSFQPIPLWMHIGHGLWCHCTTAVRVPAVRGEVVAWVGMLYPYRYCAAEFSTGRY